jgi:hypothetical protein
MNSSLSLASSTWCKVIDSVERYMKMQVLISKTFLEKGATISIKDIPKETILLRVFPFSLKGRATMVLLQ